MKLERVDYASLIKFELIFVDKLKRRHAKKPLLGILLKFLV